MNFGKLWRFALEGGFVVGLLVLFAFLFGPTLGLVAPTSGGFLTPIFLFVVYVGVRYYLWNSNERENNNES